MKFLTAILLSVLLNSKCFAQSKGDNAVIVKDITFVQLCSALLDAGFVIDKKDNELQTVKTEFKEGTGKNKWMKLLLIARVKDSAAIITGRWYNTMFPGHKVLGKEFDIENSTEKIEYTIGNAKNCFNEMKKFALSFKEDVVYLKQ